MNGATLAARALAAHGVSVVFTLCGDHTNPLLDALEAEGIRLVDTRDERGAAWMAAGWALGTGRPGVCVVSNTPALLNAAIALADCTASGVPVLCITGGVALGDRGHGHPGDADQAALARPWVRSAATVPTADEAGIAVAVAMRAAMMAPRGAAVLDLPLDVQTGTTDAGPTQPIGAEHATIDVTAAREALAGAREPVIIAGEGCFWSSAGEALRALVESARIPVFTARAARGLISDDHELCFGFPNLLAAPVQVAFGEADVAIVAGTRLDLSLARGGFHPGCTVIRIDDDHEAFAVGRGAEIELRTDPATALAALADVPSQLDTDAWLARLNDAVAARAADLDARDADTDPMHPAALARTVADTLDPDAIVVADAGELALWCIDAVPARGPSGFNASSFSALGALGMGVPWAIGLALAQPDRRVIAVVGDGSFGFTAMEVETAVRHGAPITVVVGNDGGWGIVRHLQDALHGRPIVSDLPRAAYEALGAFAGARATRVTTREQLARALAEPGPHVINAEIDAEPRHPALAMIEAMFAASP